MMAASALTCCGSSLPLSEARDLCKQLRACLSDKSSVVQKGAAEVGKLGSDTPVLAY